MTPVKTSTLSCCIFLSFLVSSDPVSAQGETSMPEDATQAAKSGSASAPFDLGSGDLPEAQAHAQSAPEVSVAVAQRRYAEEFIWFENAYIAGSRSAWLIRGTFAYQGRYHRPLEGEHFYLAIERNDLARRYRKRHRIRRTLIGVGFGAAFGAPIYGLIRRSTCSGFTECSDAIIIGGPGMLVGMGLVGTGLFINPHPIPVHEARALADGHNRTLRRELGLPDDYEVKPMSYRQEERIRISPFVTPKGGGIFVSGRL